MSEQQTVEAARARIQRLVDEIAGLSKSEMRSEEYYQQFLTRAVTACDGRGGAVWLVGQRTAEGKSEFQLAAAVDLESSLFQNDEQQRGVILRSLGEVVQTKKPLVLSADNQTGPQPGSLQAQLSQMAPQASTPSPNRTPFPFVHVPLFLKEQVLGVLQVWLQPYVTRENYVEFATFLTQLAAHVEQFFQSRRLGNLVVENQRLQQLLKFISDLTGSLDPQEVARLAANYGRDLLGCERCAVAQIRGTSWETLSISGQEVVEKKSSMVKCMTAFIAAHTPGHTITVTAEGGATEQKAWVLALSKKELLALAENGTAADESRTLALRPNGPTTEVDAEFFESSQVTSTLLVQLLDTEKQIVGALLAESTSETFFEQAAGAVELPSSHRLAEWLASNTGRALRGARDHKELPFLFATKRLRDTKRRLTGSARARHWIKLIFFFVLFGGVLLFPWMEEIESDCTLVPHQRVKVVPEVSGRIEEVFVREGQAVKKGDPLAQLDISMLETQLKGALEEKLGATAEAERFRGMNEPAGMEIALTRVRAAEAKAKGLQRDIAAATLRSPIDGVVLTKDIELSRGVFLQAGTDFTIIGALDSWDLQVHLHEKQVGRVETLLDERKDVPVRFILYTHNTHELGGVLKDRSQLSQIAYPHQRENAVQENAFILTLSDVQTPQEIRAALRPDLTGRASVYFGRKPLVMLWARNIGQWFRLKWVW